MLKSRQSSDTSVIYLFQYTRAHTRTRTQGTGMLGHIGILFSFLKNLHPVSEDSCIVYILQKLTTALYVSTSLSLFSLLLPLLMIYVFDKIHSNKCQMLADYDFNVHFPEMRKLFHIYAFWNFKYIIYCHLCFFKGVWMFSMKWYKSLFITMILIYCSCI